jgi:large subunit ribosomal protein L24
MKIKKGDNVIMLAGKDKGKKGKVLKAMPKEDKVIVEGLNIVKRHVRPRKQGKKGEILSIPSPVHVSNVKLADSEKSTAETKKTVAKKITKAKK